MSNKPKIIPKLNMSKKYENTLIAVVNGYRKLNGGYALSAILIKDQ